MLWRIRKISDKLTGSLVRMINLNPEKKDKVVWKLKLYQRAAGFMPKITALSGSVEKHNADGLSLEIFKAKKSTSKKLIVNIHGGGFIMGLFSVYRNLSPVFSYAGQGASVVNIDYRTAPDHMYPAAHDDVLKAWDYLLDLGYAPEDIILIGDSAGGNLLLSLLLRLRDANRPMPAAAVTISAWTCLDSLSPSFIKNYRKDVLFGSRKGDFDDKKMAQFLHCGVYTYIGDADNSDKYLSVSLCDYHNMPPMLMIVGGDECLLEDTLIVADKIKEAGGDIQVIVGEGMFHAYPLFYHLSATAKQTFSEILAFISKHTRGHWR